MFFFYYELYVHTCLARFLSKIESRSDQSTIYILILTETEIVNIYSSFVIVVNEWFNIYWMIFCTIRNATLSLPYRLSFSAIKLFKLRHQVIYLSESHMQRDSCTTREPHCYTCTIRSPPTGVELEIVCQCRMSHNRNTSIYIFGFCQCYG